MTNPATRLSDSHDVAAKVTQLLKTRGKLAVERYAARVTKAVETTMGATRTNPIVPWQAPAAAAQYAFDFMQRSILFWDTLRQRGNNFIQHTVEGMAGSNTRSRCASTRRW